MEYESGGWTGTDHSREINEAVNARPTAPARTNFQAGKEVGSGILAFVGVGVIGVTAARYMNSGDNLILVLCGVDGVLIARGRKSSTSLALWLSMIAAALPVLSIVISGLIIKSTGGPCLPHRPLVDDLLGVAASFLLIAVVNAFLTPVYLIAAFLSLVRERWRRAVHFLLILSVNTIWIAYLMASWDEKLFCGPG